MITFNVTVPETFDGYAFFEDQKVPSKFMFSIAGLTEFAATEIGIAMKQQGYDVTVIKQTEVMEVVYESRT